MRLKYRVMSFPNFPWGIYTEERNLGWGLPHLLGLRNHYDFLKDRNCRYAVMVLLLRSQARWRLSRKLELNKETDHHLDLEELWLCLPSVQHQGSHRLWPTRFHLPPTSTRSTRIPAPLSKLQTCTFNSQLLIHKSMPPIGLRVTNAKVQHTIEFPFSITYHPLLQLSEQTQAQHLPKSSGHCLSSVSVNHQNTPKSLPTLPSCVYPHHRPPCCPKQILLASLYILSHPPGTEVYVQYNQ